MPRRARRKSDSEIYHVMLRGVNRCSIFGDEEDRIRFLTIIEKYKQECDCRIYAWCLMTNHVHLVMQCENPELFMRKVGTSYVYYYNAKNGRVGHLFQDRYRSEPVENDKYLLSVIRYVHMNPVKAFIVAEPERYAWSSYREYLDSDTSVGEYGGSRGGSRTKGSHLEEKMLTDTELLMGIMGLSELRKYTVADNKDVCLDINEEVPKPLPTDSMVMEMMEKITGCRNADEFHTLNSKERNMAIKEMRDMGASIVQISRIVKWSRGIIYKAIEADQEDLEA